MSRVQTPPAGNLKERIAALQQRSVSAPQHGQQQPISPSKPSSPTNGPAGSLRSKIAKFESKGGVPIPRGSFGLGAPPEGGLNASRELYGNRIPGVNRPSGPASRSDSPLPGADEPSVANVRTRRRSSTGAFEGPASIDLAGVSHKLAYQRNLDILNGTTTPSDATVSPTTDPSPSPSDQSGNDSLPTSPRRRSMQVGRRSASSTDVFTRYGIQPESIDPTRLAPSIVVSPESASTSPSIIRASKIVDEPAEMVSNGPVTSSMTTPASPPSPKVPSPTLDKGSPTSNGCSTTVESSPVISPVSIPSTNSASQTPVKVGHEHPPDSPYLEFTKPSSPPSSPPTKVQGIVRKVTTPTSPSKSKSKTNVTEVTRPTRSSSLAPILRSSRSPSPTPSMIHRPESVDAETPASTTARKTRTTSNARHARRTVVALPANPLPAPDNEEAGFNYGSVILGSHSETNLLDPSKKNKSGFSAVVHRKVTESTQHSDARSVRSVPNMTSRARLTVGPSEPVPPISPGYGDLADLLAEAALLEERLTLGEAGSDFRKDADKTRGDSNASQALSVPSVDHSGTPDTHDDENQDQVPPPPPPKGFPRMFSGLKKLAGSGSLRSMHGSHPRVSTSGSELSSEDSASVGTPSENGIPFPGSYSNGRFDRQSSSGSSAFSSSLSPKKTGGSMNRATAFAEKIWHRSRTKSNNSGERGESLSPRKSLSLPISTAHSKSGRTNSQPPNLPPLPPILSTDDPTSPRPISWRSQSSATSTNTNSTVSPSGRLFDTDLFDAFPSVPLEVPEGPFITTTSPRQSYDIGRSATIPPRTRSYSAQKLR